MLKRQNEAAGRLGAQASGGIPYVILCDTALVYGFATSSDFITEDLINQVIEQKQHFAIFAPMNR